ncbi:TatD family hydrolase [Thiolapillus sp.]
MLIDSHCHLDRVDLSPYQNSFSNFMQHTRDAGVGHLLCVSIDLESYPQMLALVSPYEDISVSVGVHPNDFDRREPSVEDLLELAAHPRNVAIGETGLDFFRSQGDLDWQRKRFRTHIRAAIEAGKPLIVHTRDARQETLKILTEEKAVRAGGVLHCFTESWDMASAGLDMGFYISFSGIVTFNSARELRDVAARVPLDRLLIETDSPYLAPAPYRGKPNEPKYLYRIAQTIAELRGMETEALAKQTAANFRQLFGAG